MQGFMISDSEPLSVNELVLCQKIDRHPDGKERKFVSKTIVYPLYGKVTGIGYTQRVFDKTKVPRIHKHNMDKKYGASPHIIKCTQYQGKTLQMGVCRIRKISVI